MSILLLVQYGACFIAPLSPLNLRPLYLAQAPHPHPHHPHQALAYLLQPIQLLEEGCPPPAFVEEVKSMINYSIYVLLALGLEVKRNGVQKNKKQLINNSLVTYDEVLA